MIGITLLNGASPMKLNQSTNAGNKKNRVRTIKNIYNQRHY